MTADRRPRPADLDALLLQSIADRHLSRTERKVLRDALGEAAFDRAQIAELRSRVSEIAAAAVADPHSRAYFAPGDDRAAKISELIRSARRSVDVCVFTITGNRTRNADLLNFENFLVTDDPALVAAYGREFDRLLALFS